jgi:LacI family transcriptional regulator
MMEVNYHEESKGYEAMQKLLDLPRRPDAVFAASDPLAIGAMPAALDAGFKIPEQIGLIGLGAQQDSKYLWIPLSTIDQRRSLIAREAARLLLDFVHRGEPTRPKQILLEPQLVIRATSSPSAARTTA